MPLKTAWLFAGLLAMPLVSPVQGAMDLQLVSAAFSNNQPIPRNHACDGEKTSPPLRWSGAPPGTRSYALVVHDPDAPGGDFTHWLVYDLPATVTELPSGTYREEKLALGGLEGANSFGATGYGPPCPPAGPAHRYIFTLYALNQPSLGLHSGASQGDVERAMQGKILARSQLVGLYHR